MLFGYYIAKKLARKSAQSFTKTVVRLAIIAVSISITVVIVSFGILLGFKKEIREKVSGYAGHITVSNFDLTKGSEHTYLDLDSNLLLDLRAMDHVLSVSPFINKAGILKSDSIIEGLIFRGVASDYNLEFYQKHLVSGRLPNYSDSSDSYEILISSQTANILETDTGEKLNLYFVEEGDVKRRRPVVVGIFNTGLQSFDKQFAICDLRMIQRVLGPDYKTASGYEIKIDDFAALDELTESIDREISTVLKAENLKEQYFTMFQWLKIVDTNVLIIIVLMFIVAIINIITVLLILIIERIPMIGLFKSMGARDKSIMQIFSWQGVFILLGGLIIGNVVALSLAYLQQEFQLIKLSAETYYMDAVPFHLPLSYFLAINISTIVVAYFFTWIPALIVSGVSPTRSIQFK